MLSFSDRLKAVVNNLDAAGTSLQNRAIGQRDPQSPSSTANPPSSSRPASPIATSTKTVISATGLTPSTSNQPVSPSTKPNYTASGAALAENALSGLSGLRKSFHFAPRPSGPGPSGPGDHTRPQSQELKDLPQVSKVDPPSRSGSPARFVNGNFQLGSEGSSKVGTPVPRPERVGSPLPPPNPDDPASFPLPASPELPPLLTITTGTKTENSRETKSSLLPGEALEAHELELPEIVSQFGEVKPDLSVTGAEPGEGSDSHEGTERKLSEANVEEDLEDLDAAKIRYKGVFEKAK
jgi:hypothetical protein